MLSESRAGSGVTGPPYGEKRWRYRYAYADCPTRRGNDLQQIVRRGSTSTVRCRRAMTVLASADGNRVPVIAQLVAADEDTLRDLIASTASTRSAWPAWTL